MYSVISLERANHTDSQKYKQAAAFEIWRLSVLERGRRKSYGLSWRSCLPLRVTGRFKRRKRLVLAKLHSRLAITVEPELPFYCSSAWA
jgi:hypothetical protein